MSRKSLKILAVFGFLFIMIAPVLSIHSEKSYEVVDKRDESHNAMMTNNFWPMHKNDARRNGYSPCDSSSNLGGERWKYLFEGIEEHTAVIDSNGTLYISMYIDLHGELHAINPNGTEKWTAQLDYEGYVPAIGPDGTIYVGTRSAFYAFHQNGSINWVLNKGKKFNGEPVIDDSGTIYVGTDDGYLYSILPNGSIQWEYYVGNYPIDPAIDHEGNIYFTTYYQKNLYCLNANGTLKWKKEIYNFQRGPVIGSDGTIYVVPIHWIMAINPDGTEKWTVDFSYWEGFPTLAPDGTIILSGGNRYVTALNPSDGSILWKYQISTSVNPIDVTEAVIDGNGTIYFAYTYAGKIGYLCALNPDGTLKWETHLTSDIQPNDGFAIISDPSMGLDGTVYLTTWLTRGGSNYTSFGYLYAIGKENPSPAPTAPIVTGTIKGRVKTPHEYTFQAISPTGDDVYYFIDWGDYEYEDWIGPYPSGIPVTLNHTWDKWGTYTIQAEAKSIDDLCGLWSTMKVTMPFSYEPPQFYFIHWLLERFPHAFPILRYLIRYT